MGPTILLDKSAFQALSSQEMCVLGNYFHWNRVNVLNWEVIGDLNKNTKTKSPRKEISILADKFIMGDSTENADASELCEGNLFGDEVVMDGRPVPGNASYHRIDGQLCAYVDERPFCDLIHRWQRGEFTPDDELLARLWKQSVTPMDTEMCREWLIKYRMIIPRCTSLGDLAVETKRLARNPRTQRVFLDMLMIHFGFDQTTRDKIRSHMGRNRYPLQATAPYAHYCVRVFALFLGGVVCDLITRRPTDRVDLEYLFYLPFCNVFSSGDKFHRSLAPLLMTQKQVFLSEADLKNALDEIDRANPDEETLMAECWPVPPMSKTSKIRDIWVKTGWLYEEPRTSI